MVRFDRFTEKAQEAAMRALEILQEYKHGQVDTEHLFLALMQQEGAPAAQVLKKLGTSADIIAHDLVQVIKNAPRSSNVGHYTTSAAQVFITPRLKSVIDMAHEEAILLQDQYTSTEHILLAIASERDTPSANILLGASISKERLYQAIIQNRQRDNPINPVDQNAAKLSISTQSMSKDLKQLGDEIKELAAAEERAWADRNYEKAAQIKTDLVGKRKKFQENLLLWESNAVDDGTSTEPELIKRQRSLLLKARIAKQTRVRSEQDAASRQQTAQQQAQTTLTSTTNRAQTAQKQTVAEAESALQKVKDQKVKMEQTRDTTVKLRGIVHSFALEAQKHLSAASLEHLLTYATVSPVNPKREALPALEQAVAQATAAEREIQISVGELLIQRKAAAETKWVLLIFGGLLLLVFVVSLLQGL